jgi:hypothetical protein
MVRVDKGSIIPPAEPPQSSSSYISSQADLFLPDRLIGAVLLSLTAPYFSSYLL